MKITPIWSIYHAKPYKRTLPEAPLRNKKENNADKLEESKTNRESNDTRVNIVC